jgi:xylulokinase
VSATLGIDIGLSGVRASVMREDGSVPATARVALPPRIRDGIAEQDPNTWVPAVIDAGARAVDAGGIRIDGVGVTALGPAPILIDADGRALASTPLFGLDRRADRWRAELSTGPDHALPTLLRWREEEPDLMRSARSALDVTGFVVRWLTGADTMDRITAESYRWKDVDPPVALPAPAEPDAEAAGVAASPAAALGLHAGTPVAVGTIDCFADVAAAGVAAPGDGAVLLGSTLILYAVGRPTPPPTGLDTSPHLGEGVLIGGSTATAGLALDWLAGILGVDRSGLSELAAGLDPGSGGLLALPYLAGERTPLNDPAARGVLAGLTLATGREQVYRSLVDGIAITALDMANRLEEARSAPEAYRVAGGGVHDPAWLTATCDALGVTLEVMPDAGAAVGAAWLAHRMRGEAPQRRPERVIEPNPARHGWYRAQLARSKELWAAAAPVMHSPGREDLYA